MERLKSEQGRADELPAFNLFQLPKELQLEILGCDPILTYNLTQASDSARALYVTNCQSVLTSLFNLWPEQLRNIIRVILGIRQDLITPLVYTEQDIIQLLDSKWKPDQLPLGSASPLATLKLLRNIDLELRGLTELFARRYLCLAAATFRIPEIDESSEFASKLSPTESYRITRALLRYSLYKEVIRLNQRSPILLDLMVLQETLSSWEAEEVLVVNSLSRNLMMRLHRMSDQYPVLSQVLGSDTFIGGILSPPLRDAVRDAILDGTSNTLPAAEPSRQWTGAGSANRATRTAKIFHDTFIRLPHSDILAMRQILLKFGVYIWDDERMSTWQDFPPLDEITDGDLVFWSRIERYLGHSALRGPDDPADDKITWISLLDKLTLFWTDAQGPASAHRVE